MISQCFLKCCWNANEIVIRREWVVIWIKKKKNKLLLYQEEYLLKILFFFFFKFKIVLALLLYTGPWFPEQGLNPCLLQRQHGV